MMQLATVYKRLPAGVKTLGVLIVVLWVGAGVRLHALGAPSLWLDEAYTWYLLRPSWHDIWSTMQLISDTSPLYYVVMRLWTALAGESEFALRFVGAAAELLTVPVIYRLGRDMFGRAAGWWACAVFALSPFAVWYARDARPYGLYVLSAALALWGFWRWAERGRPAWGWVAASAVLYLTHYASALFVLVEAVYLISILRQRPLLFRRWFVLQAVAALPVGIYALTFFLRRVPISSNAWIPRPGLPAVPQTLINFLSADAEQLTLLGAALAMAAVAVLAAGRPAQPDRRATRLLGVWLLLPMTAIWLFSFRLPAYIDRFFFPEIIALAVLLGAGLAQLGAALPRWRRAALAAGALVLGGGMALACVRVLADPAYAKEDWRGAAHIVDTQYADLPMLVGDSETVLGLLPYRLPQPGVGQAVTKTLDATTQRSVVVLRSQADTNHGLTKSAIYDPVTDSDLAGWFAAHPRRVEAVHRLAGVGIVVLAP
jgi:mannosyltransferase